MDIDKIYWHTAFLPVLQLELEPYLAMLSFEAEHQLTTKSLQIDVVIIKKEPDTVIDNPIAYIFKKINIFEYKSPTISLSIGEFYRAIAYVFLYGDIHNEDITDMSLSIVLTRKPEEVFKYIQNILKYEVRERESGIYEVVGFLFPLQIIESKKISKAHNAFLPLLNDNLDREAVSFILAEAQKKHTDDIDISAFVDVIIQANPDSLEEVLQMGTKTLEEVLEKAGLAARWEERTKTKIAQKLIQKGWACEEIADTTGLDIPTVESLMGTAQA